ncbi:unnamed protein product [Linum tenue]|uniref:Uncharacterized protein n=1 Tax=Linum tenue TaxID=586396 RepID=A0AAV0MHE3_9ROSI|nr:unnamed protein product [Linum tenue]
MAARTSASRLTGSTGGRCGRSASWSCSAQGALLRSALSGRRRPLLSSLAFVSLQLRGMRRASTSERCYFPSPATSLTGTDWDA